MVSIARRAILIVGLTFGLTVSLRASEVADYKLGDKVTEDIITPIPLTVVNPDATEDLKVKEETRTPIILRYDPSIADKAEAILRDAFSLQRSNFLKTIEATYNKTKLTDANIAATKFLKLIGTHNKKIKGFVVTTNLAELWARGDSGRVVQAALITRLREAMDHPVRPTWPDGLKLSYTVRIVPVSNAAEVVTLELAEQRGFNMVRADLLHITRVRTNLQGRFTDEEKAFAKFTAAAVRPNCLPELELTAVNRARKSEGLQATDTYEVGQVVARTDQLVDRKILAALDQLREKTTPVKLQEQITVQRAQAAQVQRRNQWLIAGLAVATGLSVLVIWRLARRKQRSMALVPVGAGQPEHLLAAGQAATWSETAVMAEPNSERARAAERAGVFAHLAQLFREKLVRGLINQRSELLDAQRTAAAEMADMEQRLNKLHAPLQDRLQAYEKRIAELEKALAAKGDENRELIKAKIELIRKQLETERSRNRLVLN